MVCCEEGGGYGVYKCTHNFVFMIDVKFRGDEFSSSHYEKWEIELLR
jgi:hypothetical protein